jgi:hypothetical protein
MARAHPKRVRYQAALRPDDAFQTAENVSLRLG